MFTLKSFRLLARKRKKSPGKPKGTKDFLATHEEKAWTLSVADDFKMKGYEDYKARTVKHCWADKVGLRWDPLVARYVSAQQYRA